MAIEMAYLQQKAPFKGLFVLIILWYNKKVLKDLLKKKIIVLASGSFDPVHIGHVKYFQEARRFGDKLIVVIKNDNWLRNKKGYVFMPQNDRKEIIESFSSVDEVIISKHSAKDKDISICREIKKIKPDIIANEEGKFSVNVDELKLSKKLEIKVFFNVGYGAQIKKPPESLKEVQKQTRISFYQEKIKEFEHRLEGDYSETTGSDSWQKWIYENNWLFGIQYQNPIEKEKEGFDSIPDYLFPTWDGFIDILEIKKPTERVIKKDSSHSGSYMWSSKVNESIGQAVNYINEVDLNKHALRERIEEKYPYLKDVITVRPRAYILIGESNPMSRGDKEALRKLNYSLHGIEVITYTDLLTRGKKIIEMYQSPKGF